MILEQLGERVRELRKAQGLSQEKFAFKAEIDRTYLAGIEQGKRNPSIKSLEKIIQALDVSFHTFFEGM
ncbi:helix-turn-helix domain-containing protein [Rodentibacter haemolyticus]|uniref:Helix-turn-helix transcriptional regulator n=1 Tax=Rodentibacter haemolyticus TaxID=2778911 RepID=A0ABX6UW82_9PAST|nr:helix-turn-helix transcriptional regulator [Rodentibacter haemolyticus]QPB42082.1 helix-turn-helix transcriptional regulator [Rodentibacter haemolyticus]